MCEKSKEGRPRRVKFNPFAKSSGQSSTNKVAKKQEPCGCPRRRKQVVYSKIIEVSKGIVDSQSKVCSKVSKVKNVESFASTQPASPKRNLM